MNKGHGRLETREIWTSTQMNEWFERDGIGIAQVFMIQKRSKKKVKREERDLMELPVFPGNMLMPHVSSI
ncbi:MAG: hypothetical protein AUI01_04630 [Ktedonobacter sp. 13_2_20CM_2_56_8]|nr:MAG: hypothetical protein AUI01_04630 [Ktedonobacter sp. 13_2_20CM_2_56_8]